MGKKTSKKKSKNKTLDIRFTTTDYTCIDFKESIFSGNLQFFCPIELFLKSQLNKIKKNLSQNKRLDIYNSMVRISFGKMYKGHKFNISVPKYAHKELMRMFRSCSDSFDKRSFSLSRSFCDIGEIEDSNVYTTRNTDIKKGEEKDIDTEKIRFLKKHIIYDISCKLDHLYPRSSEVPRFDLKFQVFTTQSEETNKIPDIMNTRREYHIVYTSSNPYMQIHLVDIDYHKFYNVYVDIPCKDIIQYDHENIIEIVDCILLCMQKRSVSENSRNAISLPYVIVHNEPFFKK